MSTTKPILTITGSDSTSGSGIQADIQTISELGDYAVTAVTSITVQTTLGIQEFFDLPAEIVGGQIEAVMNDVAPDVVKIGMLRTLDTLAVIVAALKRYRPRHVVYDPIVLSSSGEELVSPDVMAEIHRQLLPLCTQVVALEVTQSHGLANRYASALAVYLNKGVDETEAASLARAYLNSQIARAGYLHGRSSDLYNEFMTLVEEHYLQNSDVHYYADHMNVTPRYLAQVTRRICGQSPKSIIDSRLVREIASQLATTPRTVQEIAYGCGFSSQAHLTKFFKKQLGVSPTEYRKAEKSQND